MTFEEYCKLPGINWSTLKFMRLSSRHYLHATQAPPVDAAQFRIGRAGHTLVLEPEHFPLLYVCWERRRQGKLWEQFEALATEQGKTVLTPTEWKRAVGSGAAVIADDNANTYLAGVGERELSLQWVDEETGLTCKARLDFAGRHLVELKSTAAIEPRRFSATCARMSYHAQMAMQWDGLAANGFKVAAEPVIVCVESVPPHDVAVYLVPAPIVELGRREYRGLLRRVAECTERGEWPGVAEQVIDLALPEWAYATDPLSLTLNGELVDF
jgi:hypothetical protein